MTSKDKDFCTILDKLLDIKGQRDLLLMLHELCLTSLLTSSMGRRTFLIPPASAVAKLKKAKPAEAKEQLRRHILNKLVDDASFKTGDTLNVGTMVKNNRYDVKKGKKDEIIVDGVKCKLVKRARNGVIYQADGVLKENIVERSESKERGRRRTSSGSRSRSRTPKSRRSRKQRGGGYFPLVQNYKSEYDGSLESRLLFIQQYQDAFKNQWAPYGLGHLLLYLNQNVGDLKNQYIPFLGSDPTTSLELLLGLYEKPWNSSRLLIDEPTFAGFASSPFFLSGDQALMMEARELMESLLSFGGLGSCAYESPSIDQTFIGQSRGYLSNILKTNPVNLGENVMSIYKIMVGEPNRFNPGHMRIFEKVWEDPAAGLLKNDLIRFSGRMYDMSVPYEKRYQEMSSLFGGNARDVINRIINNEVLTRYTGQLDGLGGLSNISNFGGLSSSTDYENLLDYLGLWVKSDDFAHSFQIDLGKQGVDSIFGGLGGLSGLGYSLGAPSTSLNFASHTTPFSSGLNLSGSVSMPINAPSLTAFGSM